MGFNPFNVAYMTRMRVSRLLHSGADLRYIIGHINRLQSINDHVKMHLIEEAVFFYNHWRDLGLVFVIDVGLGPFWSTEVGEHFQVLDGPPMVECSELSWDETLDGFEKYHLLRGFISQMMSSRNYQISELTNGIQGLEWLEDREKIGLIAEVLYYEQNCANVIWTLDGGDHTDFFDMFRAVRIDVTTSLFEKRGFLDHVENEHLIRPDYVFAELQLRQDFNVELSRAEVLLECLIETSDVSFREINAVRLSRNWLVSHPLVFGSIQDPWNSKECAISLIFMLVCDELQILFPEEFELCNLTPEWVYSVLKESYGEAVYAFAVENLRRQSILAIDMVEHLNEVDIGHHSFQKPFGNLYAEFAHFKVEEEDMIPAVMA